MRRTFLGVLAVAMVLAACDSGPDPEAARTYAGQIEEKVARQCQGYETFLRRAPPRSAETRMITAPLKLIELFPPIFFAPFDEQEFERFLAGYPDDVEAQVADLTRRLKRSGSDLQRDYGQPTWQNYCNLMREMSRTLRSLG